MTSAKNLLKNPAPASKTSNGFLALTVSSLLALASIGMVGEKFLYGSWRENAVSVAKAVCIPYCPKVRS